MSDIETMNNIITGLTQKKKNLQADVEVLLKLSGINEEIEKAIQDRDGYNSVLIEAKKRRDDAKKKKAGSVSKTMSAIAEKMNSVLPHGKAVFSYDEDDDGKRTMLIGWENEGKTTPYKGLSGGEGKIFDADLAHVLDANIIIVEAAELDSENLEKTLIELANLDKQVIVNTCHPIKFKIPEPFVKMEV